MLLNSVIFFSFSLTLTTADCPFPTILNAQFNKCYAFFNQPQSFPLAENNCQTLGGHLVAIQNSFENSYVNGIGQGNGDFWIGLNYLQTAQWTWTSNATASYMNWAVGQPSDPSIYQCAIEKDGTGLWTKELCNAAHPFVCEVPPSTAPNCGSFLCGASYTQYAGDCKCYKSVNILGNFNDAKAACAREYATLPIILDQAQNQFIANLVGKIDSFSWIGLECVDNVAGDCTWVNGTKLSGYNNFIIDNPQGPYATVMELYAGDIFGKWSASNYNAYAYPICMTDPQDES